MNINYTLIHTLKFPPPRFPQSNATVFVSKFYRKLRGWFCLVCAQWTSLLCVREHAHANWCTSATNLKQDSTVGKLF